MYSIVNGGLRCVVACAIALSAVPASARPSTAPVPPDEDDGRPWARGVAKSEQEVARNLHADGNAEFAESRFAQALAKYREAIGHWDHPSIRFNMAVSLINLDELVEARDNLESSLVYGVAALGADAYAQALAYRKLLDAQLAHVKVTCSEPGTVVTLDGKYLFTAPGSAQRFLLPGDHQFATSKAGFRTTILMFKGISGKREVYELRPSPDTGAPRWRHWKYVLGGGAVVAGAGALLYVGVRSDIDAYDQAVKDRCPAGCDAETVAGFTDLRDRKARIQAKQAVALSLLPVGGTAIVVGLLGLILDQPRVRPDSSRVVPAVALAPGGATVSFAWPF